MEGRKQGAEKGYLCASEELCPAATFPDCLCSNPYAATYYMVTMNKLFKLQVPQCPYLQKRSTSYICNKVCACVVCVC